jgi:hypothetical protein
LALGEQPITKCEECQPTNGVATVFPDEQIQVVVVAGVGVDAGARLAVGATATA